MRPRKHHTNNYTLAAPPTNPDGIGSLPCTRVQYENGQPAIWSYWQPTEKERALIASGRAVRLEVLGTQHPPVRLSVDGDAER